MRKYYIIIIILILQNFVLDAQNVGINATGAAPDTTAILDISSAGLPANNQKGILIPRVELIQKSIDTPIVAPTTSLLIYNTANINDVYPGYYYWDSVQWVRIINDNDTVALLLPNGTAIGNTSFWDGTEWVVNNNNIFNNGGNVGIGTSTPSAKLDVNGELIRTLQYATANGPDEASGVTFFPPAKINSRVLNFNKKSATSKIKIAYTDVVRVYQNAGTARFEIRVNNISNPGQPLIYDFYNGSGNNRHLPLTIQGIFTGLPAGNHEISIWVIQKPGYPIMNVYLGWDNCTWLIEAEEIY